MVYSPLPPNPPSRGKKTLYIVQEAAKKKISFLHFWHAFPISVVLLQEQKQF